MAAPLSAHKIHWLAGSAPSERPVLIAPRRPQQSVESYNGSNAAREKPRQPFKQQYAKRSSPRPTGVTGSSLRIDRAR